MRPLFCFLLVLLADCCGPAQMLSAQISIKESRQAYWSFPGAEVANGQVSAPVGSRPKLDRIELTIRVETAIEYKFAQMKARKLPEYERVTLEEVSKNVYRFRAGAPEGVYLLEYTAIDPGIASDEIRVTLDKSEPVEPLPEPDGLPVLTKEARRAMQGLAAGMAADMDKAADAVDKGQVKTVLQLSTFTIPLDVETRNKFKKSLAGPLEKTIGSGELPQGSVKALREIAAGFRSVQ